MKRHTSISQTFSTYQVGDLVRVAGTSTVGRVQDVQGQYLTIAQPSPDGLVLSIQAASSCRFAADHQPHPDYIGAGRI